MSSLEIREFKEAIVSFTNKSELPMEVKRLVFNEILFQLNEASLEEIKIEIVKRDESEKKIKGD